MVKPTGSPKSSHHKDNEYKKKVASHRSSKEQQAKKTRIKRVPPKRG